MSANAIDRLDPRELGQNLKVAREQRGMRQGDAADVLGVARTTITAIEQGKRRIKPGELLKLAAAYGRSVGDFMRPRPTARNFQVQFREPTHSKPIEFKKISKSEREFQDLCRDYVELEAMLNSPIVRNYPDQYQTQGLDEDRAAEAIASQERNRLGLGDGPLPMFRPVLEHSIGIRVFYIQFSDSKYSEMYYYDDELGGCLAVNQNHPEERRRWSLAHGYAHFLAHRYEPVILRESTYKKEKFADYFAKYFLMPTSSMMREYNKILQSRSKPTVGDLCVLAHYYGVSLAALVRRLEGLRIAPKGTWDRIKSSGFKVRAAQEQLSLQKLPEQSQLLPLRYRFLAVEALAQDEISEGMLAKFLRIDRLEARGISQILTEHDQDVTDGQALNLNIFETV